LIKSFSEKNDKFDSVWQWSDVAQLEHAVIVQLSGVVLSWYHCMRWGRRYTVHSKHWL